MGFKGVPVVSLDGTAVHGVDLQAVAHLLQIPFDAKPDLEPKALRNRLIYFLDWLVEFVQILPSEFHDLTIQGRKRTLWEIVEHVVELSQIYRAVATTNTSFDLQATDAVPESNYSIPQLCQEIRKLRKHYATEQVDYSKAIDAYYGETSLHLILERTAWHTGQHLRQLDSLLTTSSDSYHSSLDSKQFEGLPIPNNVWD